MVPMVGVSSAMAILAGLRIPDLTPIGVAVLFIGVAGTIAGALAYGKQRAGETSASVWERTAMGYKEEAQAEKERGDRMSLERDEQRSLKHAVIAELGAERMKTDLSAAMEALRSVIKTQDKQTLILERIANGLESR